MRMIDLQETCLFKEKVKPTFSTFCGEFASANQFCFCQRGMNSAGDQSGELQSFPFAKATAPRARGIN